MERLIVVQKLGNIFLHCHDGQHSLFWINPTDTIIISCCLSNAKNCSALLLKEMIASLKKNVNMYLWPIFKDLSLQ